MKVKIKKKFRDKYTKQTYFKNEEHDFTEERIMEIQETDKSLIEVLEEQPEADEALAEDKPAKEDVLTDEQKKEADEAPKKNSRRNNK